MGTIADKLQYLKETKNLIKQALTDMGQPVSDADTFRSYADKIKKIENPVPSNLDDLVDGKLTSFIMPTGKTKIAPYLFYQMTSLVFANLGAAITVGAYAFYECLALGNITLPSTLKRIDAYAFASTGTSVTTTYTFSPSSDCFIGNNAFFSSSLGGLSGKVSSIGNNAFTGCFALTSVDLSKCGSIGNRAFFNCSHITKLHAPINGRIGDNAFYQVNRVSDLDLSGSVITSIDNAAFSRFGGARDNPSQNILLMDFRESVFTTIGQYSFGGNSSITADRNIYMIYKFPSTVKTIGGNAFGYNDNCDYYFTSANPPTLSATTAWDNATNYKIFVPFGSINAYRTATNWTAQVDKMTGYIAAGSLPVGSSLPTLGAEGYALTWYSDKACTVSATTVEDENAIYYCTAGTEKLGYGIKSITAIDCSITISDGTKNYIEGEGVPEGTVLTITGVPAQSGYVPYVFKVNDQNFTSGGTFTMNSDLSITAIYYDGQNIPASHVFNDNSWVIIREVFRSGLAATLWAVGDTKEVELNDGNTYHIRIADMQDGRYNLADGSGSTKGVLEFVECLPNYYAINPSQITDGGSTAYTAGGWAKCYMKNTVLDTTVWGWLPDDMRNAISEITLNEYSYTGESPRVSNNKLFLPAETEIFASRHSSAEGYQTGCVKYDRWDVYASITTSDGSTCVERQKKRLGQTSTAWWWLRSPYSGNSYNFCIVSNNGNYNNFNAYNTNGVSPCFAI